MLNEIILRIADLTARLFPFECMDAEFMRRAMLGLLLIAPLAALSGVQVVNSRMSFFSDAIGHSAFAGVAVGLIFSLSPDFTMPALALVIGLLTQKELYEKTVSNMMECKSRGAYLMGITTNGNFNVEDSANFTVYIPKSDEHFMASLAVVPLQLLAYYTSVNRGLDVDKPRNLAKSVTVE